MQTMQQTVQPSGLARILDPVSLNRAARAGFSGLDNGTSLFMFAVAGIFTLAMGAIWWQYDLLSTWHFSQGINADVKPVADIVAQKAAELAEADISVASFIGGAIVVAITLAPSIVELIAPRVMHPGAQLLLNGTILFDFVTDWPTAAGIVSHYHPPFGFLGRVVTTALVTLSLSLFVQVLFILALTVTITCALNIVGFGNKASGLGRLIAIPNVIDQ